MQRNTTTRTTRARSLRALSTITALLALGLGAGTSLADHDRPRGHGYGRDGRAIGHAYEACGRCDRRDHHTHDDGGVLWVGGNRFGMWDGPGAIEALAGELRRAGYRVTRWGNELRLSSRRELGALRFSTGKFRVVVTDRDRCAATIRFYQVRCEPVVVRPVVVKPGHGRRHGRGGWSRPVIRSAVRWGDARCDSRPTISFRW